MGFEAISSRCVWNLSPYHLCLLQPGLCYAVTYRAITWHHFSGASEQSSLPWMSELISLVAESTFMTHQRHCQDLRLLLFLCSALVVTLVRVPFDRGTLASPLPLFTTYHSLSTTFCIFLA